MCGLWATKAFRAVNLQSKQTRHGLGSMDMKLDPDLRNRLDRQSFDRNGNPNFKTSISPTPGSGLGSASILLQSQSQSQFVNGNENENVNSHSSKPDVEVTKEGVSPSQSFLKSNDSLSPEGNQADGEAGEGQKKVKAPRLYHKKSRNGCQRCKARRVKVCLSFC